MTLSAPDGVATQPAGSSLFRANAVRASAGTQIGEPLATHWRAMAWFTAAAFLLVAALIVFAARTDYAPVYRVPSYVEPRGGLVRLAAPIGGRVRELDVEPGAFVQRGALLAVVESDRLRADGGSEHGTLRNELEDERATVDRETDAARQEAEANDAMTARRLSGLATQREALQAQIQSNRELLRSLTSQSEQIAALAAKGYVSSLQAAQKKDEVTGQQSRLAELQHSLAGVDLEIATSEEERRLTTARLQGLLASRRRAGSELERLMTQSDSEAEQAIRAPTDGVVSTALIASGQSVAAGQSLFTIAPGDAPLLARLLVPARAAASVKAGMQVKVAFRAYPQEKFGQFDARIEAVNDTPSLPAEIERMYSISEPVFVATAALPETLRSPDGQVLKIKAGMLADVLVPIEHRTVLQWLFEPMLRGFHDSADRSHATTPTA